MISSRNNQWLKDMRRLRTSKGRRRDPRLLLEGPHLLGDALRADLELEVVLATPAFLDSDVGILLLDELPRPPIEVDLALLDELADADSPRGLLAVARPPARDIPARDTGTYVFADGLQDPGNLGALARVCEAAGVAGLFLSPGCVSARHPRALRGSAGSLLRLPHLTDAEPDAVRARLGDGATWISLAPRGGQGLYGHDAPPSLRILAVGAEGQGLSPAVAALA
ncbi:MAG: TrmH family RNA methyltransferase, partial [Acidobacteriota bacterium]